MKIAKPESQIDKTQWRAQSDPAREKKLSPRKYLFVWRES
jgi:hypothetical protein